MSSDDRNIDRSVDPSSTDPRPDLDHFGSHETLGGRATDRLRDRLPDVRLPAIPAVWVVVAALYGVVVVGVLSVGYGATSMATAYGGVHAGLIVGGVFAFVVGYLGLLVVGHAREP